MSQMVGIERTSSIEDEPRTLKFDQLHFAREAALYVVNTRSIEEALTIFTEGLEPVIKSVRDDKDTMRDYSEEEMECVSNHLKPRGPGDIASAPF